MEESLQNSYDGLEEFDPYWRQQKLFPVLPPEPVKQSIKRKTGESKLHKKSKAEINSVYSMFERDENNKSRIRMFGEEIEIGADALTAQAKHMLRVSKFQKKLENKTALEQENIDDKSALEHLRKRSTLGDFIPKESKENIIEVVTDIQESMEQIIEIFRQSENLEEKEEYGQELDLLAMKCTEIESFLSKNMEQDNNILLEIISDLLSNYVQERFKK